MNIVNEIYQAIGAVSKKVNSYSEQLDSYFGMRADENKTLAEDAQEAIIESDTARLEEEENLEAALIELDETIDSRLNDIELALCELSEQEEE